MKNTNVSIRLGTQESAESLPLFTLSKLEASPFAILPCFHSRCLECGALVVSGVKTRAHPCVLGRCLAIYVFNVM